MHGLVNRALQGFLVDTYGSDLWRDVVADANLPAEGFESMMHYDDALTDATITVAVTALKKDRQTFLEDLGTYLLAHKNQEGLRRLMRFGGETFFEFLISLDDLSGRAQLAVPDLDMPALEIRQKGLSRFEIRVKWSIKGAGFVFLGALRAMADDYGTLAIFDVEAGDDGSDLVVIELLDTAFAEGKSFSLGAQPI